MENTTAATTSSPREVFWYLLLIITLYLSIVGLLGLLFQEINILLPDQLGPDRRGILNGIRWSSAILVVAFPVYLYMTRVLNRDVSAIPARREARIRKWLLYLTLFLAALTIIIDLITLIYNFYGGELTARFGAKALAVMAVAVAVFWYYRGELRREQTAPALLRGWMWGTGVLVVLALVGGVVLAGSPAEQRRVRFDEERVANLQSIQYRISDFWRSKEKLPGSLSELDDPIAGFQTPVDPVTGRPYEYAVVSEQTFELCAEFATKASNNRESQAVPYSAPHEYGIGDPALSNWAHGIGRTCFTRTIDPDLYRDAKPPVR